MTETAALLPCPGANCYITALYLDGEAVAGYELFAPVTRTPLGTRGRRTAEAVEFSRVHFTREELARAARLAKGTLVLCRANDGPFGAPPRMGHAPLSEWLPDEWSALAE